MTLENVIFIKNCFEVRNCMHLANADSSEALKMTSIQGNNVNDNRISDTEKQFYKHSV